MTILKSIFQGDLNGFQQNTHGLDIGALLQKLLGGFTQSKSFNGQMQYINKQTGQSATCEDLKSFLQQEIDAQQSPYGNFQETLPKLIFSSEIHYYNGITGLI